MLTRCSVFAGGFDLSGACAVTGRRRVRDPGSARRVGTQVTCDRRPIIGAHPILDAGDDPAIRRRPADADGFGEDIRAAHARYFAGREADVSPCGTDQPTPGVRVGYGRVGQSACRVPVRGRPRPRHRSGHRALRGVHRILGEHHEPLRWTEDLIEPAHDAGHRRLAQLYSIAALCFTAGRIDESLRYAEAGRAAVTSGRFDEFAKRSKHHWAVRTH